MCHYYYATNSGANSNSNLCDSVYLHINILNTSALNSGYAMNQTVNYQPLTIEAWVWIPGQWKKCHWDKFFSVYNGYTLSVPFYQWSTIIFHAHTIKTTQS